MNRHDLEARRRADRLLAVDYAFPPAQRRTHRRELIFWTIVFVLNFVVLLGLVFGWLR